MEPKLVLIVGSPRSGTTWLQSLLGSHHSIVTPQETDLFRLYLQPLSEAWDGQLAALGERDDDRRRKGLPTALTTKQFDELGTNFVRAMVDAVRTHKPSATVVLEKSPGHSLCTDVVQRFWPDAAFVHVIRDGRDVVSSLTAASHTFGPGFAPPDVRRAARLWSSRLVGAQTASTAPGGYTEIRYEDLHRDGVATLRRAFDTCGVAVSDNECEATLTRFEFAAMADAGTVAESILTGGEFADDPRTRSEPEGFFRRGTVGGWRDEWDANDRVAFDTTAGDLLVELGYEPDHSWVGSAKPTPHRRADAARRMARILRGVAARVESFGGEA